MLNLAIVVGVVAVCQVYSYTPDALADQVTALPGTENLSITFNQFSGYLQIPGKTTPKNIHYWLLESQNNPAKDPLGKFAFRFIAVNLSYFRACSLLDQRWTRLLWSHWSLH